MILTYINRYKIEIEKLFTSFSNNVNTVAVDFNCDRNACDPFIQNKPVTIRCLYPIWNNEIRVIMTTRLSPK